MKRMLSLWLFALAATAMLCAQNVQTQDDVTKKKVRDLKLSEEYVYAEANSMSDFDEARQVALEKLKANAISLMANSLMQKADMERVLKSTEQQRLLLEYRNGSLYKVFACLPKNCLVDMTAAVPEPTPAPEPAPEPEPVATVEPEPVVASVPEPIVEEQPVAGEPVAESVSQPEPETATGGQRDDVLPMPVVAPPAELVAPSDSAASAPAVSAIAPDMPAEKSFDLNEQTAAMVMELLQMVESKPTTPDVSDTRAATVPEETGNAVAEPASVGGEATVAVAPMEPVAPVAEVADPMEGLSEKHRKVLEDLLSLDTYESVMLYLNAMKEDGRMIYGPLKKIFMPERAYLLIVKDGKMVTILNKGTGDRINLKTRQAESIRKYIGYGIIWFQIFN